MPLPFEKGPDRWLSFARASLLWADLLACLHLGSAKVAHRCQQLGRQTRALAASWITGSGEGTAAASFSTYTSATTSEASCAAMCPDAPGLMATGHEHGIRLWGMPEMAKLGVIRTRCPVIALDLGRKGDFLAAIQTGPAWLLCVWDLTLEIAGPGLSAPLWSMNVPSVTPLQFFGASVLVPRTGAGLEMLDASDGASVHTIDLPGCPQAACPCIEPQEWCCEAPRVARTCIILAVGSTLFAIAERGASTHVQGSKASEVFTFAKPQDTPCSQLVSLGASSTEVASSTSDGQVLVWKLVDRTLLGVFPTFTVLDFENLSWSVGKAETVFPSQPTQMLALRLHQGEGASDHMLCILEDGFGA